MKRVAAIDLGSNAIRLTIAEVTSPYHYKVLEKIRFPVRIGMDVFNTGEVSASKTAEILEVFRKFDSHLRYFDVKEVRAVATSALRDAKNGNAIVAKIEQASKIKLKIITGQEEANGIYEAVAHVVPILTGFSVLIDIGGGSTELSFVQDGVLQKVQSFNIGTIRMMQNQTKDLPLLIDAIKSQMKGQKIKLVGTGGNLRRMGKLRKKIFDRADPTIIHKSEVLEMYNYLKMQTPLQLMKKFDLKHDRAEVIIPALQLFTTMINYIDVDIIHLPKVGLSDSLILKMSHTLQHSSINLV